jgi:hypothetical protein
MADEKDGGKPGGWFPNLNNLLLILVAGTLLVNQHAFHESRPSKPESAPINQVNARLWQDPLEAVGQHIANNANSDESMDIKPLQDDIKKKLEADANDSQEKTTNPKTLNVVAVMLPGTSYFEDGETRRRLRYAVLSGFNAALRYIPEDPNHIHYFDITKPHQEKTQTIEIQKKNAPIIEFKLTQATPVKDNANKPSSDKDNQDNALPEQRVAYEWMVYKPRKNSSDENALGNPPILILWLNNDTLRGKPYASLMNLFQRVQGIHTEYSISPESESGQHNKQYSRIQDAHKKSTSIQLQVKVLGPYDSDNLEDMVKEFEKGVNIDSELSLQFYSPSATVNEHDLLHEIPRLTESWDENKNLILQESGKATTQSKNLQQYFRKKLKNYYREGSEEKLKDNMDFLRVTSSDQNLAVAIKQELFKRGIKIGKNSRVLLVGEWDTLYGWHLPSTFATELVYPFPEHGPDNYPLSTECTNDGTSVTSDELKHLYEKPKKDNVQKWDEIYDENIQCIFRYSYLRGLDAEGKAKSGDKAKSNSRTTDTGKSNEAKGEDMEDADGDSQFDYVRRMADQIANLDQSIRDHTQNPAAHAIKAIGILGSDFYDKELILEALHDKFPDAVFFTNGLDARFQHPKVNQWARNLLQVSRYGLTLDRHLQWDIPPFRDSTEAAYFLATEMALAKVKNVQWFLNQEYQKRFNDTLSSQDEFDKLLKFSRINEVGRTQLFDVSQNPEMCYEKSCLNIQPSSLITSSGQSAEIPNWNKFLLLIIVLVTLLTLICFRDSREFLSSYAGCSLVVTMLSICIFGSLLVWQLAPPLDSGISWILNNDNIHWLFILLVLLGILYVMAIKRIAIVDDEHSFVNNGAAWCLFSSLVLIAEFITWLWWVAAPDGWLDGGEQYSLVEGVSMWPTQGLRLLALCLAGYFIVDVYRFHGRLTAWLRTHFTNLDIHQTNFARYRVLDDWFSWQDNWRRMVAPVAAIVCCILSLFVLYLFGMPNIPHRGATMLLLDHVLMRGFLISAYLLLLFVVVDAVLFAVGLVDKSFPYLDKPNERVLWPSEMLSVYAQRFMIDGDELNEWMSMRFVNELTEAIYRIIGYPLVVALLIVLARNSYFDNWVMPISLKIIIALSLGMLLYLDYRLKNKTAEARTAVLKTLRQKVVFCNGSDSGTKKGQQLEKLISMIEHSELVVYQSFVQRPIFRNSLLILLALLADSADYSSIVSKLS